MTRYVRLPFATGIAASALLAAPAAFPCTTFLAQHAGQPVMGKDYDWMQNAALVVSNPRGLRKTAVVLEANASAASWTSQYASLTFNQYGVEFPNGGMNEKGLAVEIMWLDSSEYPAASAMPAVNELAWIQYALDRFATVGELVAAAPSVRVSQAYAKVHYLACDTASDCAAFEYIGGQLVITQSKDMLAKTLTNGTYAESVAYLKQFEGFGGTKPPPTTSSSQDRFARASISATVTNATTIPSSAFAILDSVAQTTTQWSIVYSLKQKEIAFRTKTTPKVKTVRLADWAVDCPAKRKVLDIDTDAMGDVASRFADFTKERNQALLAITLAPLQAQLPSGAIERLAAYPDACACETGDAGAPNEAGSPMGTDGGQPTGVDGGEPTDADGGEHTDLDAGEAGVARDGSTASADSGATADATRPSTGTGGMGGSGGASHAGATGGSNAEAGTAVDAGGRSGGSTSSCQCAVANNVGSGEDGVFASLVFGLLALLRRRKR